jgi:hypothetical protein
MRNTYRFGKLTLEFFDEWSSIECRLGDHIGNRRIDLRLDGKILCVQIGKRYTRRQYSRGVHEV